MGLAAVFFVKNDAFLYQTPVGRIESVKKISKAVQIDHFKNLNDSMVHEIGDQSLQVGATTLKLNFRHEDNFFSYWGE